MPARAGQLLGYQPVSYFAPHPGYSSRRDPLGPADEFRDMVEALHRAGIEVILDVVYNHTAEGGHDGPAFGFRGIDIHRFVRLLFARRVLRGVGAEQRRVSLTQLLREANKAWHGVKLHQPDWGEHARAVVLGGTLRDAGLDFHLILNAHSEPLEFELPSVGERRPWRRWIDTFLPSPQDIVEWQAAPSVPESTYRAGPRSVVMLHAQTG